MDLLYCREIPASVEVNVVKEEGSVQLLCNACLSIGQTLYQVTDEKLKLYYLTALNEIRLCNMPTKSPHICLDCKALLKKTYDFREQVKDSHRILMTYTSENLTECLLTDVSRPPRLKLVKNDNIDIEPDSDVSDIDQFLKRKQSESVGDENQETKTAINGRHKDCMSVKLSASRSEGPGYQSAQVFVKEELKIEEYDSDRDADFDIPLVDLKQMDILSVDTERNTNAKNKEKDKNSMKKDLKRSKKIGKVKKRKKSKKEEELSMRIPSITSIQLSYEEMMEERRRESDRDSYMHAEFKCRSCVVGFNYNSSYNKHLLNRHSPSIGNYTCPICNTVLATLESFSSHYKRHMKRYECNICQKRTIDVKSMHQHYYSTHEITVKQYKCAHCGKVSNSLDAHRYHTDTHKSRLQCNECDKTFRHRGGLLNHKVTVHEARNKFPCTYCDKVFRWKNSLKRHMPVHEQKQQTEESAAYCTPCAVGFASVGSYRRHLANSLQHVSKEHLRYICDHCKSRFADKTKLRDHIEEKHLHKTYQCNICLKTFMNRVNLDQHTRNIHKGRPNNKMCHHCGKGFPTKAQLESHIRTHTGERPYICELCPTTFSQHSNLYKHNRQVHLNMKSKRYSAVKKQKDERQIQISLAPTDLPIDYPVDIGFTM